MAMATPFRAAASGILILGTLAAATACGADEAYESYRRALALSQAVHPPCDKGTVRQRLDCLGRELEALNRRLEDLANPSVRPLGLP
jgi:hypothetical protein